MGRIYAIALNAFREAVRDRVLFAVLGFALASLFFGESLAWLSLNEQVRILVDHGLVTVSLLSNLVAIFLGASFLYKELELRTLYVILAKPLARWEFVLGKYLGILATILVFEALTVSALLVLLGFQVSEELALRAGASGMFLLATRKSRLLALLGGLAGLGLLFGLLGRVKRLDRFRAELGAAVLVLFALFTLAGAALFSGSIAAVETRLVLYGAVLTFGEVAITAAFALFFSSFSTPFVTAAFAFGMFLVGRSAGLMLELRGRNVPEELRVLLRGVSMAVPNLQLFVPSRPLLLPPGSESEVPGFVLRLMVYAGIWAAVLLTGAATLFRRRDLT